MEHGLSIECMKTAPKRGRPVGHRGAEWLTANWDAYNADARRVAFWRHCNDIRDGLHSAGIDDWLPSALARVLDGMQAGDGDNTWVEYLFSSRPFCKRKNDFVSDLRDIAQAEWGLDLSHHALEIVGLSRNQYQDLRNSFSKSIYRPPNSANEADPRAGMITNRPWYTCPVIGTVFNLPQPLLPLYRVDELMAKILGQWASTCRWMGRSASGASCLLSVLRSRGTVHS